MSDEITATLAATIATLEAEILAELDWHDPELEGTLLRELADEAAAREDKDR